MLQLMDMFTSPVEPGQHTDTRPLDGFSGWPQHTPAQRVSLDLQLKMASHLELVPNQSAPQPRFDDRGRCWSRSKRGSIFDLALRACAEATPSVMACVSASTALLVF
jgi:hypothetical protein